MGDGVTATLALMAIVNLLPQANSNLRQVYGRESPSSTVAAKIRQGEWKMGELLPEFWYGWREEDGEVRKKSKLHKTRKVTDICTWVQCFSSNVAT